MLVCIAHKRHRTVFYLLFRSVLELLCDCVFETSFEIVTCSLVVCYSYSVQYKFLVKHRKLEKNIFMYLARLWVSNKTPILRRFRWGNHTYLNI